MVVQIKYTYLTCSIYEATYHTYLCPKYIEFVFTLIYRLME